MNRRTPSVTVTVLDQRTRALARHLPAAINGDGIGVHQARVASRRLREAVPVFGEDVPGRLTRKALGKVRRVTRALGVVRELDVTLTVLDAMAAANIVPRLALEEVRRHVVEEREARREEMLKRLDRVSLERLNHRLAEFRARPDEVTTTGWRPALRVRLVKRARALVAAIDAAGQMYSPESLHQVRIAAKKLRYGLEIASETGVRAAGPLVTRLKRTQDALGRLHDLQVLLGHVAQVQAGRPGRTLPKGSLDTVAEALERECRHLHAGYLAGVPKLLEVAEATTAVVAPAMAARARVRRSPADSRGTTTGPANRRRPAMPAPRRA